MDFQKINKIIIKNKIKKSSINNYKKNLDLITHSVFSALDLVLDSKYTSSRTFMHSIKT